MTSKETHAVSAEIRSHVKNVKAGGRMTFLQQASEARVTQARTLPREPLVALLGGEQGWFAKRS